MATTRTTASRLPNFAKLALQFDRSIDTQSPIDRMESELAIANAALCKSRERAEDAERDLREEQGTVATLTDERNQLQGDLDDANAKITYLDDALAAEGVKLTTAWKTIQELRARIAELETPMADSEIEALFNVAIAPIEAPPADVRPAIAAAPLETPPEASAPEAPKRSRKAAKPVETATAVRRAPRQRWDAKTGQWQPA